MTAPLSRVTTVVRSLSGADVSSVRAWWTSAETPDESAGGPPTNQRLTALTGAAVLPLAALVLPTGLFFGDLWRVHYFDGFVLLPVALLKLGSTAYRMARYYLRSGAYRLVRPPYPVGRLTSPILVVAVAMTFVSGIAMWLSHSQADPWGWLHTDAVIVFSAIALLHLGMYLPEALRSTRSDIRPRTPTASPHRARRLTFVWAAVIVGVLLALATIGLGRMPARAHRFPRGNLTSLRDRLDTTTAQEYPIGRTRV